MRQEMRSPRRKICDEWAVIRGNSLLTISLVSFDGIPVCSPLPSVLMSSPPSRSARIFHRTQTFYREYRHDTASEPGRNMLTAQTTRSLPHSRLEFIFSSPNVYQRPSRDGSHQFFGFIRHRMTERILRQEPCLNHPGSPGNLA